MLKKRAKARATLNARFWRRAMSATFWMCLRCVQPAVLEEIAYVQGRIDVVFAVVYCRCYVMAIGSRVSLLSEGWTRSFGGVVRGAYGVGSSLLHRGGGSPQRAARSSWQGMTTIPRLNARRTRFNFTPSQVSTVLLKRCEAVRYNGHLP